GTLPNTSANMARWIRESQAVKPGSRMPAYRNLPPEELDALVDYLAQLR
ncbi:MAG: cytochrome C oxidase subunit II, partial [Gammaproteobacteria bacterium]|nr:cytochrome C oxidase subunit II [Gammaproteobacteria bacterium]